jgi:hypothetical protein
MLIPQTDAGNNHKYSSSSKQSKADERTGTRMAAYGFLTAAIIYQAGRGYKKREK